MLYLIHLKLIHIACKMTTIFTSLYLAHHCCHYTSFTTNGTKTQLWPWNNYFTIILDFIMVRKLLINIALIFVLKFHTCIYVCQSMSKHFLTIRQLVSYHLYSQIPQDIYYLDTFKNTHLTNCTSATHLEMSQVK